MLIAQLCPNLCDPIDYSLPRSSVHGIPQARILKWVDVPDSRYKLHWCAIYSFFLNKYMNSRFKDIYHYLQKSLEM